MASSEKIVTLASLADGVADERFQLELERVARRGISLVAKVTVPNPVLLKPYRTFSEVEQPASPFVLRMKEGQEGGKPGCALFDADGGAWRLTAIQAIAAYLRAALPATIPVFA